MSREIRVPANDSWKEVDFFLRLHGHLPDYICSGKTADGKYAPFGNCIYRIDGIPINHHNDFVYKLRQNSDYIQAEEAVKRAQQNGINLYLGKLWTVDEAFLEAMKGAKINP